MGGVRGRRVAPLSERGRLREVAALFLRLGFTAFGGPAAHIALIEEECVRRRRWITREQFLDVLGVSNLIPGPTSTELAMHVGFHRAGWAGLIAAGICFILPAALLVGVLAVVYVRAGELPALEGVLRAVKPVALVVVLHALVGLSRTAVRSIPLVLLAAIAALAALAGLAEIQVLLGAGILHAAIGRRWTVAAVAVVLAAPFSPVAAQAAAATAATVGLPSLFGYFLKAGSLVFGSGYVLLAVLRGDLVQRHGWLAEPQLLDAIAVGQVTPGPVFTTATFLGYLLNGTSGAIVATVAIFLPAFVFSALSIPVLQKLRRSPTAGGFLDGVNAAAVSLIAVVAFALARSAVVDLPTASIMLLSAILIGWFRVNSTWVIATAAAIGVLPLAR